MHDTASRIGRLAMRIYSELQTAKILEIGSQSVNGSLREGALPSTEYIGLDIAPGEGVDIVIKPGGEFPVPDNSFDMVLASSVFEHDSAFWLTFLEMCRKARDGGYVYINAPSNGAVHRYPDDNWRFYPDSGKALASWAVSQGEDVSLVESFVANRDQDIWNDFVAVFRKGPIVRPMPRAFIYEHIPCTNVITWRSDEIIFTTPESEDMILIREARDRKVELEARLSETQAQAQSVQSELRQRIEEIAQTRGELTEAKSNYVSELHQRTEEVEQTRRELLEAKSNYASELHQRMEEIEQTRAELVETKSNYASELHQRMEEIEQTRAELVEARSNSITLERRMEEERRRLEAEVVRRQDAEANARSWNERSLHQFDTFEQMCGTVEQLGSELVSLQGSYADLLQRLVETRSGAAAAESALKDCIAESTAREARLKGELASSEASRDRLTSELVNLGSVLQGRMVEVDVLSSRLRLEQERATNSGAQLEWLCAVSRALVDRPSWWSFLPKIWRARKEESRLLRRNLFDADAYLANNPDVAASGINPIRHYIIHGILEGRPNGI